MKAPLTWVVCGATAMLLAGTALAQNQPRPTEQGAGAAQQQKMTGQQPGAQASQAQQPLQAKKVLGKDLKNPQGESLGKIQDFVISPQNDRDFALIDLGNNRFAPVPIQALSVTTGAGGEAQVTANVTKQQLQSGPTVTADQLSQLSQASFTQQIYSHYNVQPATSAMGGAGAQPSGAASGAGQQPSAQPQPSQQQPSGTSQQPY